MTRPPVPGEKRLFWKAKIAGTVKEWETEITNQVADQSIAWESIDRTPNSGTITFDEVGENLTRINATIGYDPSRQISARLVYMLARLFLLAIAVILVRRSNGQDAGLTCLAVIVFAFTVWLAISFTDRPKRR